MTYLTRLWRVVVWALLLGIVAVLLAAVLVPRLTGATPYTVLTGSMQPDLPPGTLVVTRPVDSIEDLAVGDVITYQLASGEPTVVTHRVVAIGSSMTGERSVTTQGDANEAPDAEPVREVQVRGKLWYAVPQVGRLGTFVGGDQRQVVTDVVALGLAAYALFALGGALRERRRPQGRRRAGGADAEHGRKSSKNSKKKEEVAS